MKTFATAILTWFDKHGRKGLPWQENKTPYRVWISEIMLQQTQVKTVIPYYLRFMQRFPTVQKLAQADTDDVLHYWSGLGYYSRARNLHLAAKKIAYDHGGVFPDSLEALQALPGIGRSTAGAILAIAFQVPTPILDGNVKRVLARFHGVLAVIDKGVEDQLWQYATTYLPKKRSADYTQAMMDLGATLCTRTKPVCVACPLQSNCQAFKHDLQHVIPQKKVAKALPIKTSTFLIFKHAQKVLLKKRQTTGIWGGLWSFPELTGAPDDLTIKELYFQYFQNAVYQLKTLPPFRHTFSHYHLDIHPILIELPRLPRKVMEQNEQIWYNLAQPASVGIPKPIAQILKEIR